MIAPLTLSRHFALNFGSERDRFSPLLRYLPKKKKNLSLQVGKRPKELTKNVWNRSGIPLRDEKRPSKYAFPNIYRTFLYTGGLGNLLRKH
ncbi:hypothetical protein CEXT_525071 [Caerostris extrusa]|uniref:Uncharacterized protein n=1 Tax=Caerostris extrusa TaxID=172846 RepID=A0AAV4NVT4_CAEEX|nr:hypothetical protein CEXT_525071 [Caerostris extrusa]